MTARGEKWWCRCRRLIRMNLTSRVIVLTIMAVMPALGIQTYNEYQLRRSREADIRHRAVQITKQFGEEMGELREGAQQLLIALAHQPSIQRHDAAKCDKFLSMLRANYPNYHSLAAVDLTGNTICSSEPAPRPSVANLPFFKRALKAPNRLAIGDYWQNPVTKAKMIHFAMHFVGKDGHPDGMVVAALDLGWLSPHLADRGLAPGASILIADRDGNIIARLPHPEVLVGKNMRRTHEAIMDGNKAGWEEAVGVDGKARIFGYVPAALPPYGLFLSAGLSKDEAFADIDHATSRGEMLIIAGLLVAILAACLGGRRFVQMPLRELTRVTARWRDGDFNARANVSDRASELGELAGAFNEMAAAVMSRQNARERAEQELLELTMSLEERVAKRTQELEQANRVKSQFLANMSHEIRTPMNGVLGMLELLLSTQLSTQQTRYAKTALRSGESLLSIVNGVLDLSKIESGKLQLVEESFDLHDIIEESVDLFSGAARAKNIYLSSRLSPELPHDVIGDSGRVRQVLTNLLGNAIKFTKEGGVSLKATLITGATTGATVEFSVHDTGIGIPQDRLSDVFDAFAQGDGSTTRRYGGTGLGLSIARQLCELMGGSIHVESALGVGSTFRFTVPFKLAVGEGTGTPSIETEKLDGLNALVVDDQPTNLEVIGAQLQRMGVTPRLVNGALEALDVLRENAERRIKFDIIFIDNLLPDIAGPELARRIRQHPETSNTYLVMLSSSEDLAEDQVPEVNRWLIKPVRQSELRDCVMTLLTEKAAARSPTSCVDPASAKSTHVGRALLVEDNEVNQEVTKNMLRREGWEVTTAENGLVALELFSQQKFDIVLMDCQMPEMDGFQATAAIRAREIGSGGRTLIVALTANAIEGDRERCLRAGMDDYISKPISRDSLRAALWRWHARWDSSGESSMPAETAASEKTLCQKTIAALREMEDADNPTFVRSVMIRFVKDSANLLRQLQDGAANRDAQTIRQASHSLKSTSAVIGAISMSESCATLESAARDFDMSKVSLLVDEISRKYNAILPAVDAVAGGARAEVELTGG
jgi:signal transduction histidine kinase/DNA-binding response OmpR family regulator